MINQANESFLDSILDKLGMEDAIEIYEYALAKIPAKKNELKRYLLAEDWLSARQAAHRSLSSARLYGTDKLDELLNQVRLVDTPEVDPVLLEKALSDEFDYVSKKLRQWLDLHTEKLI